MGPPLVEPEQILGARRPRAHDAGSDHVVPPPGIEPQQRTQAPVLLRESTQIHHLLGERVQLRLQIGGLRGDDASLHETLLGPEEGRQDRCPHDSRDPGLSTRGENVEDQREEDESPRYGQLPPTILFPRFGDIDRHALRGQYAPILGEVVQHPPGPAHDARQRLFVDVNRQVGLVLQ